MRSGLIRASDLNKIFRKNGKSSPARRVVKSGLSISGYLKSEVGLGQAARNIIEAVDTTSIPISLHDLPLKIAILRPDMLIVFRRTVTGEIIYS